MLIRFRGQTRLPMYLEKGRVSFEWENAVAECRTSKAICRGVDSTSVTGLSACSRARLLMNQGKVNQRAQAARRKSVRMPTPSSLKTPWGSGQRRSRYFFKIPDVTPVRHPGAFSRQNMLPSAALLLKENHRSRPTVFVSQHDKRPYRAG